MLSSIGLIVGAYVILRCLEIIGTAAARWQSSYWRMLVSVVAVLVILLTAFLSLEFVTGGLADLRTGTRTDTAPALSYSAPTPIQEVLPVDPAVIEKQREENRRLMERTNRLLKKK